ncbi:MAG: flagellar hook-length control protein FliK, partial [Rhodospirillales bacterium]|nr:flagellar hook-length control protein FliK [Rhodospirillales bacterium]
ASRDRKTDDTDDRPAEKSERPDDTRDAAGRDDTEKAEREKPADDEPAASKDQDDNKVDETAGEDSQSAAEATDTEAKPADRDGDAAADAQTTGQESTDDTAEVLATQMFTNGNNGTNSATGNTAAQAGQIEAAAKAANGGAQGQTGNANAQAANSQAAAQATRQASAGETGAQVRNQISGDKVAEVSDTRAQQAASLSRTVGNGNRVSVQSGVTSDADVLVSRPTAALSASVVAATDNGKPVKPVSGYSTPTAQPGITQGAEATVVNGQTDQSNAQAARAQANAASAAAARGAVQMASGGNGASGQAHMGTGESFSGTQGQTMAQTSATQQTAQAQAAKGPKFSIPTKSFVDQISVQISKAVGAGTDRINIQLRPESLGRVDVRMEVAKDGRVNAVVTADNKNTLDMLQRDARELERALQDAGLQTDSGSLSFNLKGQQGDGQAETAVAGTTGGETEAKDDAPIESAIAGSEGGIFADGRVDIRA